MDFSLACSYEESLEGEGGDWEEHHHTGGLGLGYVLGKEEAGAAVLPQTLPGEAEQPNRSISALEAENAELVAGSGAVSRRAARRKRRRESQGREDRPWMILTDNGTEWGPLSDVLLEARKDYDAVLGQEHHKTLAELDSEERWLRQNGWQGSMDPAAESSGGGSRGGTLVATRRGPGLAAVHLEDDVLASVRSRVSVRLWGGGGVAGGIMLVSIYLWHTEGLSARNRHLLACVGEVIRSYGRPFVIGGDFNMEPDSLAGWEGWQKLGASIVAPTEATCVVEPSKRTQGSESKYDYFVVAKGLLPLIREVFVDYRFRSKPHRAVGLKIGGGRSLPLMRCLVAAKSFGTVLPPPTRAPKPVSVVNARAAAQQSEAGGHEELDLHYAVVIDLLEAELLDLHGVGEEGLGGVRERKKHLGRAEQPRYRWMRPLAHNDVTRPRASEAARKLFWVAGRIRDAERLWKTQHNYPGQRREDCRAFASGPA